MNGAINGRNTIEYFAIVVRWWWLIVLSMILFFIVTFVTASRRPPPPYTYVASIESGRLGTDFIEDREALEKKLQEAYIPRALKEQAIASGYDDEKYRIDFSLSQNGDVIVLKTMGDASQEELLLALLNKIVTFIFDDHQKKVAAKLLEIRMEEFQAELSLEKLQEEAKLLKKKKTLFLDEDTLLKRQTEDLRRTIQLQEGYHATLLSTEAKRQSPEQSLSTTLLIIENDLQKTRSQLYAIEDKRLIQLAKERHDVEKKEYENAITQREKKQSISDLRFKSENFRQTRFLLSPTRLLRPSPKSLNPVLLLSLIMGGAVGVFIVFLLEGFLAIRRYEMTRRIP